MAVTPVPSMTDTPSFPALSDRAAGDYNSKAFAFGTHMADKFNGELVAVAQNVVQNATWAESQAGAAQAAADNAQAAVEFASAAAGATPWVSGRAYAKNEVAISQVNFQTYRRRTAGAGTTDPANDTAGNWVLVTGTRTFIPIPVPGTSIDVAAGNYFKKVVNGNVTLTFDNVPQDGCSFTLELEVVSGVVTLPSTVRTPDNIVYTLLAGRTHLFMLTTSNRGVRWRMAAANNYET